MMPRESAKVRNYKKTVMQSPKRRTKKQNQDVANVNSNHSSDCSIEKDNKLTGIEEKKSKTKPRVKSKVVKILLEQSADKRVVETRSVKSNEPVHFEEEGEIIEMEIDDGGEAARQFTSDGEDGSENDQNDHNPSEESDIESGAESAESGEISPTQNDEEQHESQLNAVSQQIQPQPSTSCNKSIEARLNTMSSTLMAMKELMEKSGMMKSSVIATVTNKQKKGKETECEFTKFTESNSETTIYKNVLQKDNELAVMDTIEMDVNSEVDFKLKADNPLHFSSSSDEPVNTTDEMGDIDVEFNERFIADCARAANDRKRSHPDSDGEVAHSCQKQHAETQPGPKEKAEAVL